MILDYTQFCEHFAKLFEEFPNLKLPKVDDSLYYYDQITAINAVAFFENELHHVEGPQTGDKLQLEPWQQYVVGTAYGWKEKKFDTEGNWIQTPEQLDRDLRKFREVFVFIPRKNGKSFLAAGFGLKGLFADNELGARVISAAADREQASLIFNVSKQIVEENPNLLQGTDVFKRSITHGGDSFQVVSAEVNTKHGKNLSTIIVDEVHAQPNRDLIDVLFTSVGVRLQPLKVMLTTAGHDKNTICYEYYDYAKKVMDGIVYDEQFFPVVFEAGEKDDWKDEATWKKANPNLGVSVTWDYFRSEYKKAKERPSHENTFKRLHLNIFTEQETRWVPVELWDMCGAHVNPEELKGKECWLGVDLASKVDITSVVAVFDINGTIKVLPYFWVPRENIPLRKKRDRVDYDVWQRQGYIYATPGNVMDYEAIRLKINELHKDYNIREIGFDPWNAQDLMTKLEDDGFEVVQIQQNFGQLTDPTKELEALVLSGKLHHGNNPVLRWMFSNIAIMEDSHGNIKLSKKKSKEKIDGMVALINALHRWIDAEDEKESVYTNRGVLTI